MYLEPDERNGYGYLKAVFRAKKDSKELSLAEKRELFSAIANGRRVRVKKGIGVAENRYQLIAKCFDAWMTAEERENGIAHCCKKLGVLKVGIYGYGMLGRHLLFLLQRGGIKVEWIMDRRELKIEGMNVLTPKSAFPEVDAIFVTVIDEYPEIEKFLCDKTGTKIISLEAFVKGMKSISMRWNSK